VCVSHIHIYTQITNARHSHIIPRIKLFATNASNLSRFAAPRCCSPAWDLQRLCIARSPRRQRLCQLDQIARYALTSQKNVNMLDISKYKAWLISRYFRAPFPANTPPKKHSPSDQLDFSNFRIKTHIFQWGTTFNCERLGKCLGPTSCKKRN